MALMLAFVFLVGVSMILAAMTGRVVSQHRQVDSFVDFQRCFEGLEAAVSQSRGELYLLLNDIEDSVLAALKDGRLGVDSDYDIALGVPGFNDETFSEVVTPETLITMPQIQYFAYVHNWATDGLDNNGDAAIDDSVEEGIYQIVVSARMNDVIRSAEVILVGSNVNVWQNAIFAGAGQAGGVINGNVTVHGSVHILGEALDAGDEAINALALGGASLINNSYCCGGGSGLSADLLARVPALDTVTFNGEEVETLGATVRVKEGNVSLSGAANIGFEDNFGDADKETMKGVYVNDNWSNLDADGLPDNVYSDNGTSSNYDLGDAVSFPTLSDDQDENFLEDYLEGFALGGSGDCAVFDGILTIQAGGSGETNDFFWNPCTGELLYSVPSGATHGMTQNIVAIPDKDDLGAISDDDSFIWFDASENELVIQGRIPIRGDLLILAGNGAGNKKITYEGKGSLLAYADGGYGEGDVTINAGLVTPEVGDDGNPNFAVRAEDLAEGDSSHVLGIMAGHDMLLGGDNSHLELMGGFYAQDTVTISMQTTIMGSIVGNLFNVSGQVPDIYQVLPLSEALIGDEIRMIGSDPLIVLIRLSWRELGIG